MTRRNTVLNAGPGPSGIRPFRDRQNPSNTKKKYFFSSENEPTHRKPRYSIFIWFRGVPCKSTDVFVYSSTKFRTPLGVHVVSSFRIKPTKCQRTRHKQLDDISICTNLHRQFIDMSQRCHRNVHAMSSKCCRSTSAILMPTEISQTCQRRFYDISIASRRLSNVPT